MVYCPYWLFMDFVTVSEISAQVFSVDAASISMTFSVALFVTLPCSLLISQLIQRRSYSTFLFCVVADVVAAWLRWLSVRYQSFALCTASTVAVGCSFAVCVIAFAVIGERWFPPERQTLATSCAVQSNYFGWGLSALIIPSLVHDGSDLERFLLVQAFGISFGLPLFFLLHDERAARPLTEEHLPVKESVCALLTCPQYLLQFVSYSVLGAVSYAVPAVQDALFAAAFGLTPDATKWTNFAFIAMGVAAGLLLSCGEVRRPCLLLRVFFVVAAASLALIVFLLRPAVHKGFSEAALFGLLVAAMAAAGGATLGFLGIALAHATQVVPGVPSTYSAGAVEWFVQAGGAILSQFAGFRACSCLTIAVAVLLVIGLNGSDGARRASLPLCQANRRHDDELGRPFMFSDLPHH